MKHLILAALSGAVFSSTAFAQDSSLASSDWYVFGQLAAPVGAQPEYTFNPADSVTEVPLSGAAAVVGIGREIARQGSAVFLLEADIAAGNLDSGQILEDTTPCIIDAPGEACTSEVSAMATGRVLIGLDQGAFIPYVTGGIAVAQVAGSADTLACGGSDCNFDETLTGWTAGFGVLYDVNDRFALKADVLYHDLGEPEFDSDNVTGEFRFSEVRIGAAYRF